ncbi:MAG: hypothetical protein R2786_04660 [Flavobacteriaceae bacterium]
MKTTTKNLFISFLSTFCLVLLLASCKEKEAKTAPVAYEEALAETASCDCKPFWFPHSQTPNPKEGKGSPFDTTSTTNCIFHQWSWLKFLYLTRPDTHGNPLFLNDLVQVDSKMEVIPQQTGANLVLTDTAQAGAGAVLKTNPTLSSDGKPRTVFYGIFIDSTLQTAANTFKAQLLDSTLPASNSEAFPVGSLEIKSSWVSTDAIPSNEIGNYFVTQAAMLQQDGSFKNTSVALLGMHVIGVVENHPEFIWATFEHQGMTPLFDWNALTASSTTDLLLFGKGSTTDLSGITWSSGAPKTPNQAYTLFQFGVPREKGNTFMSTSQSEPENYNNITNINACVAGNLTDVWNNYFYNGSLWINMDGKTPEEQVALLISLGGNLVNSQPGDATRGSVNAANSTMETFVQTFQSDVSSINNSNLVSCFTCHNAVGHGGATSPLYISHIFSAYVEAGKGKTLDEIKTMKLEEFHTMLRAKSN